MLNFLKRLFVQKEEEYVPQKKTISVDELEEFFKKETKERLSTLDLNIDQIKQEIKTQIQNTKENLSVLTTAQLHNPKISIKEKQFMQGNRGSYILGVNNFLRGLELNDSYEELQEFCDNFDAHLERFSKATIRAYQILQEFFANESKDIAINIKNIESLVKKLRTKITEAKLERINKVNSSIKELKDKIKANDEISKVIKEQSETKDRLVTSKDETEKKKDSLLKSKEYKELLKLGEKKESILADIREHNAKIIHAFSTMEKPMKKMTRVIVEDNQLLDNYLNDPITGLLADSDLKIISLLDKLKSNINNLTLELKDKKRDKVLETIKGLTEEFLESFIKKYHELDEQLKNIETKIEDNPERKKEESLNYEVSNIDDNLKSATAELEQKQKEQSRINISDIKNYIQAELKEILGDDITIA